MIIARYLTREVVNALLAVTMVLVLALVCQQMVRYLNLVVVGKIPTSVLLVLVSFEIPYLLALLLPLGLYLGILLAYGRLYADHEMAILEMVGFNARRVIVLTAETALMVAGIVLVLMLWVNPWISAKRQLLMASDGASLHLVQTLIPGRFKVSPDGTHVMYVEKMSRDRQQAETVFVAEQKKQPISENEVELDKQPAWMLVFANTGYQIKDKVSQEEFFVTTDGYRYEGTPGQNDYKITQFKKYAVRIPPSDPHIAHPEVETLTMGQLWQDYINPKYAAEFQWRISMGIATFLLALLAVTMRTTRPRQGRYMMLLPAIFIYVVYFNLLSIARHWLEQGFVPLVVGLWWVHGVMLCLVLLSFFLSTRMSR